MTRRSVSDRLVAGWFEVTGRAVLPRNRGLFGLLDEALETHFRRTQQFGFPALDQSGEHDIQRAVHP